MTFPSISLSHEDRVAIFRQATRGFARRFAEDIVTGMTDEELESALSECFGILGGCSGPGEFHTSYQGAGLKIWRGFNVKDKPLFAGSHTIAMARTIYGIGDPSTGQLSLF